MRRYFIPIIILITVTILSSCGKGISPEPEAPPKQTGFGGTLTFKGTWPQGVARTHLVVFKTLLRSAGDFNALNLAFVSDSIPYGTKQIVYSSLINPLVSINAGTYLYVAVAQSKSPGLSLDRKDWYVIGIYYSNNDTTSPGMLNIPLDNFVEDINITCDFDNPPPQPPSINGAAGQK